jgi:hypothetical protein
LVITFSQEKFIGERGGCGRPSLLSVGDYFFLKKLIGGCGGRGRHILLSIFFEKDGAGRY